MKKYIINQMPRILGMLSLCVVALNTGCVVDDQEQKVRSREEAVALNDSAMALYHEMTFGLADTSYSVVLSLLDRAAELDSTYRLVPLNKAIVLQNIGRGKDAAIVLSDWIDTNSDDVYARTLLGMVYTMDNKEILAKAHLKQALSAYNLKIDEYPDSVGLVVDRAFVQVLLGNRADALADLDSLLALKPHREDIEMVQDIFRSQSRDEILAGYINRN